MIAELSAAQRDQLDARGYVVVPDALDPGWVARLARAFEGAPAMDSGTVHVAITPETLEHEAWTALRAHPLVEVAARHVLGPSFFVRDQHGRDPRPGFGQQGLHSDWPGRAPGAPYAVLTALWMLDAFTAENGATRLVPGSHLDTRGLPKAMAQPLAVHPKEVLVLGASGSVLLLNGHLWHSGTRNRSQGSRRIVQMVVQAEGARRV